ncbi:hypothetical protein JCM8547_002373 [Rhodosporidiobolus lusitaniae]
MASAPARNFVVRLAESEEDRQRALNVRIAVFVDEQGFSMEDELDDKDATSDHFLMVNLNEDGTEEDAGTIRWWPKPNSTSGKLGRLAVIKKFRGGGSGKVLVLALEEHLKQRGGKAGEALKGKESVDIIAHSQAYAQGFYEKCGYTAEGELFLEDGADHIKVVKRVAHIPEQAKDAASDWLLLIGAKEDGREIDVGTVRWWPQVGTNEGKLGRLAVLKQYRGLGYGRVLLDNMEEHAGYKVEGEQFMEVGAPHIKLVKLLKLEPES